ncbi:MAG TPA: hypothetical protein DEG43_12680 [Acidimicrobiaceae bacterium]|jgi:hypothetical protein|nr:hypothetical protein [Acidimicrobiaceae bacterium]
MLNPAAIVEVLVRHGVRFVVIGGVAAMVHDLPLPATIDIDVTPDRQVGNLERLALAFNELEAGLLTADAGGTWFPRHPIENWASYDTLHLMTNFGPLDIVFTPDGAERGFDDLVAGAEFHILGDTNALVISIETWERLKEASGRAKDLEHLDLFREHPR